MIYKSIRLTKEEIAVIEAIRRGYQEEGIIASFSTIARRCIKHGIELETRHVRNVQEI